jgi:hypothetical protein
MKKESSEEFSAYKSKVFARFAKKARISDVDLWRTACLVNEGVNDADLGGGVIKHRIARTGEGKSGGYRSIILFKRDHRAVFVYGFAKKDLANIRPDELEAFRELAELILGYTRAEITKRVHDGVLLSIEMPKEGEDA